MFDAPRKIDLQKYGAWLRALGLFLIAAISLVTLFAERLPAEFVKPWNAPPIEWSLKLLVVGLMLVAIAVGTRPGWHEEKLVFLLLAGVLTCFHWQFTDSRHTMNPTTGKVEYVIRGWQQRVYLSTLNHRLEDLPHSSRPLPCGFVRALELLTGDWVFAFLVYRWFFTFWFLWFYFQFVLKFHTPRGALLGVLFYVALFPFSILYYFGQLTDPLSHALFALALIYLVENRWLSLAVTLALGVLAKETVVIMIPAYLACNWKKGWPAWLETFGLGAASTAAFLLARLPQGWRPSSHKALNNTELMIGSNLGFGGKAYYGTAMVPQNYLHLVLFVGLFLPFIIWNWRRTDVRLKILFLVLTPLLLTSQILFGWLYESRNLVPLLPVLTAMAVGPVTKMVSKETPVP